MHAGIRQASLLTAVAMTSAIVLGGAALAQSSDPLIGTWKLNVAKSKGISFKSGTTKIEAAGAGVKFTVDLVNVDAACPITGRSPRTTTATTIPSPGTVLYGDATGLERVDAKTTRIVSKLKGKVVTYSDHRRVRRW